MPENPSTSGRVGTFDGRYQYDHIYPRGRSGETLRAWDPQDNNRLVVIKRPASQDAPPMRAAQEVSIRNERRALERLSGHPVLTELRGVGQFRIGGQTHEYIVMDRAQGDILEDTVLALTEQGDRLPLLETLVIIDELLDLLVQAHEQQVVYNDVDAKHLFWNRKRYQLKVIDWGNAVLLDEGGSGNITRQTDVHQVGELLYFIVTGGKRFESETTPDGDYAVIFGLDAPTAPPTLQNIITRATDPNLRRRYSTIIELRQNLSELRRPLEEKRNNTLHEVQRALAKRNSHQELAELADRLAEPSEMDPGYPLINQLRNEIDLQVQRLETQSNIDAGRIYLDTANWPRAIETMLDLMNRADEQTGPVLRFIIAAAELLDQRAAEAAPPELAHAIDALLRGEAYQAALLLHQSDTFMNQLLAERLVAYVPGVRLLRPSLARLQMETEQLPNPAALLDNLAAIETSLHQPLPAEPSLQFAIDQYRTVDDGLSDLRTHLEPIATDRTLDVLHRAIDAAKSITQYLSVLSSVAYAEPQRASNALQEAAKIDPLNAIFDEVNNYIEEIHLTVDAISSFKPDSNGNNLSGWFARVAATLNHYADDLQDRALHQTRDSMQSTAAVWEQVCDALVMGERSAAKALFIRMARQIADLNGQLGQWARHQSDQARAVDHLESLSPNRDLAKRLIEGYRLWDQGKFRDAAYHMESAYALANRDGELQAIKRLSELCSVPANWLENDGINSVELTTRSEKAVRDLFSPTEKNELDQFTNNTRSESAYLKTMPRALVDAMHQHSTAANRIMFLHYVYHGIMCVQENDLHGAGFWREAALLTIENGRSNPIFAAFDTHLTGRTLIVDVERQLAQIQRVDQLGDARSLLNNPLADQWLHEVNEAVRLLEAGVQRWEDGEFKAAREAFDEAVQNLIAGAEASQIDLSKLQHWATNLRDTAATLQNQRLRIEEIAHSTGIPAPGHRVDVDPTVEQTLMNIVVTTEEQLGEGHAHQLHQWHSTYLAVQHTYTKSLTKTEKLNEFQTHFANLFINRHPTFRLYQIWREVTQNLPETEPASIDTPTSEPETIEGEFVESPSEPQPSPTAPESEPPRPKRQRRRREQAPDASPADAPGFVDEQQAPINDVEFDQPTTETNMPWGIIAAVAVVIIGVIAFAVLGGLGQGDDGPSSSDSGNSGSNNQGALLVTNTQPPTATDLAVSTPTDAPSPTAEPVLPTATNTDMPTDVPSATATTQLTNTPSSTPTEVPPSPSPSSTNTSTPQPAPTSAAEDSTTQLSPDNPLTLDVIAALNESNTSSLSWNPLWFYPAVGGPWNLGTDEAAAQGGPIVVKFSEEDIAILAGDAAAASRLRAIEIEMELQVPDPNSDAEGIGSGLYFGLGVENSAQVRVSAEVSVPRQNSIAWGVRENDIYRERTGFPESNFRVALRVERNDDGTVSLFARNQELGTSAANYPPGTPLLPVMYTSRRGIFIIIWSIDLQFDPAS